MPSFVDEQSSMLSVVLLASTAALVAPSIVVFYLLNWPRDVSISFNTSDCVLLLSSPNSELLLEYPFENLHVFLFFIFRQKSHSECWDEAHVRRERKKRRTCLYSRGKAKLLPNTSLYLSCLAVTRSCDWFKT